MNRQERYNGAIALIKTQTNYTDDKAKEKLENWDGNYMNVIKEYLNPNFQEKKKPTSNKSVNEKMMFEIRNFMDTANADFLRRKKMEKNKQEEMKKIYAEFLKKKEEFPDCKYNPPNCITCLATCNNPMCPGEALGDNKYKKDN